MQEPRLYAKQIGSPFGVLECMPCRAAGMGSLALALAFPGPLPPFFKYLDVSACLVACCLRFAPSVDDDAGSLEDCELA